MEIIVKKYEGYNRALGKYIKSKYHYQEEMKKGGFVSFEKGSQLSEEAQSKNHKDYKELSPKAMAIIKSARDMADRKGNIKPGNRLIDGMKETGVRFNVPDWCPKDVKKEGGYAVS